MDWDDLFPVFAIAAVASFVLSLKFFFDVRALRAQLAGLTDKLPMYDHRLLRLAERIDGLATPSGYSVRSLATQRINPASHDETGTAKRRRHARP